MEAFVEPLDDSEALAEGIATALKNAHSARSIDKKLEALTQAQELLLTRAQTGHLLDNFLDEMLEFVASADPRIKCFVASFIQQACKKDVDVMKKAIHTLTMLFLTPDVRASISVMKKVSIVCANIYPSILKWAVSHPKDAETERCWDAFSILKGRIMQNIDYENEGVCTMTMKFLEAVILAQTPKTENSESGRGDIMSLLDVPRDHRFISYRKMQAEANHNMQALLEKTTQSHITAQNLMVAITIVCTIARQRPEFMNNVLDSVEALHVNLPPTLGTSQVKSVRKVLKMHLIRLLKHPSSFALNSRIITLLTDLGVSSSDINKAAGKKRPRKSAAEGPVAKKSKANDAAADDDDDEYAPEKTKVEETVGETSRQSAIDITADFIYERLNTTVVTNLVIISLMTLPDEIPPAFASSYTPIAAAGTDGQKRHLARMMATQATQAQLGPGVEEMKKQQLERMNERRNARAEGQLIAPTPALNLSAHKGNVKPSTSKMGPPSAIVVAPKVKQQFNLVSATKELSKEEATELFKLAFSRIVDAERRAIQGGAGAQHNLIIVRLVSRYYIEEKEEYDNLVMEFIAQDHKQRTELALLWLAELYSQYQGFSMCFNSKYKEEGGVTPKDERLNRYDHVMCTMLKIFHEKELHKEVIFYKLILDSPLVTSNALRWLKVACLDKVYGAFGMTAMRELIFTRNRQRKELIQLLFEFAFCDIDDEASAHHVEGKASLQKIRQSCIDIVKEFWEVTYLQSDFRNQMLELVERLTDPQPPAYFVPLDEHPEDAHWTESTIHCALTLFFSVIPLDPTLLFPLAKTYARSSSLLKKEVMRMIDAPLRSIGMHPEILRLIEECPHDAETLLARIVHTITDRETASKELVVRFQKLHADRNIDIRSLIPILNAMDKADVIALLPKFVLKINKKATIQAVHKKLSLAKNENEALFTPVELLYEYHQITPEDENDFPILEENMKYLLESLHKDVVAAGLERLLDMDPLPRLFYTTLVTVKELFPSLDGFLSNVIFKIVNRGSWKTDETTKHALYRALERLRTAAHAAVLTTFKIDEFKEYLEYHGEDQTAEIVKPMRDFLPSMSNQQLKAIDPEVLAIVDDPKEREKREDRQRLRERNRDDRRSRGGEREKTRERETRDNDGDAEERERRRERDRNDRKERSGRGDTRR